jgi:hypothetical protein
MKPVPEVSQGVLLVTGVPLATEADTPVADKEEAVDPVEVLAVEAKPTDIKDLPIETSRTKKATNVPGKALTDDRFEIQLLPDGLDGWGIMRDKSVNAEKMTRRIVIIKPL